jgi:hypothetical protein
MSHPLVTHLSGRRARSWWPRTRDGRAGRGVAGLLAILLGVGPPPVAAPAAGTPDSVIAAVAAFRHVSAAGAIALLERQARLIGRPPPGADVTSGSSPGRVVGGDRIADLNQNCSAGPWVRDAQGTDLLLTAGHCLVKGQAWQLDEGIAIGPATEASVIPHDWGTIRFNRGVTNPPASTVLVHGGPQQPLIEIAGQVPPSALPLGTTVCKFGHRTGYNCGELKGTDIVLNGVSGTILVPFSNHLIKIEGMCVLKGDSGGDVFVPSAVNGVVTARIVGIVKSLDVVWEQSGALPIVTYTPANPAAQTLTWSHMADECGDNIPGHSNREMNAYATRIDDILSEYPGGLTLMDITTAPNSGLPAGPVSSDHSPGPGGLRSARAVLPGK